jgi:hypothetical protein
MDCRITIFVVLVFFPQTAYAGLFDMLDEKYINNISELPFSPGRPVIEWQKSGHIEAWVDIVGFRDLIRDEDNYLIRGDLADLAIIQYDAKVSVPGSVQKVTKSVTISTAGNLTIASLTVYLYWKSILCYDSSCWEVPHHETATFHDTEKSPNQFDKVYRPRINIVEYNNTIEQKIAIIVLEPNSSKIIIRYGNNSVTQTLKSYHVEQTEKGIYYANASQLEAWDIQGADIGRFGNAIIINTNLSAVNYSQLEIIISDIYGSVKTDPSQFNITRETYEPEKIVYNPLLFGFIGTILTLFSASVYIVGRIL